MKIETFFFFVVVEHFIAAAHKEIGFWLRDLAINSDLPLIHHILPFAKYLCRHSESVQFTVLFSMWVFTFLVFAALLPRLQREYEEAEEQERMREERDAELRERIRNAKF